MLIDLPLHSPVPNIADINDFKRKFTALLPFEPNEGQAEAIHQLSLFLSNPDNSPLFILKGYAGTGKTNLVSALSKVLPEFKWKSVLLAPTGRAAKVLAHYSQKPAQTIHKKIFKKAVNEQGSVYFSLGDNQHKNTLFIVDEASMIGMDSDSSSFSSPGILESLFEYVYSGDNCKLLFVGDNAQLPPVGCEESPALNIPFLKSAFHLTIYHCELTQVARQSLESGILENATKLRTILKDFKGGIPKLRLTNDLVKLESDELEDALNTNYSKYGFEDVLIITRSNKRANLFNQAVRAKIRYMEEDIAAGDLLMVVKNNYFWLGDNSDIGFIANGDGLQLKKIMGREELYGFNFLTALVGFNDYPQLNEMKVKFIMDSVNADGPSISNEQQKKLFEEVMKDVADEPIKGKRMAYLKKSEYYNALQVKFSYAVTCHKAQGGQWPVVFVDLGYLNKEQVDSSFIRWLYTALTRASEKVYLVNFSEDFFS